MRALGSAQADVCCIYMNVNQAALMTGLTGMSLHVAVLVFVFFFTKPPRRRYNTKLWCKDVRLTQKSQVLPLCEKTSQSSTDNEPAVHPWHSLTPSVRRHARWKKKKRGGGFLKCEIKFRTCTLLLNKHIKKTLQVKPWEHLRLKSMFYGSQG